MKTCHYNTKKNRKKQKNRVSICQNVKISKYPYGFSGTRSVSPNPHMFQVRVSTRPCTGAGFAGMGLGWTVQTRARPVCHPTPLPHATHCHHHHHPLTALALSLAL